MKAIKYHKSERVHDLREMLQASCTKYANKTLFMQSIDGKFKSYSYGEFGRDVRSLGAAFIRRGLDGKKVIVMGENSYAWCLAYMTVVCGLGVIIPVDKEISSEELASIAKISGAAAVIFSERCREKAVSAGKRLQKYSFDDIMDICKREDVCSEEDYQKYADISIDIDAMCSLIFTFGANGSPKGVMLSHRNICSNLEDLSALVSVTQSDISLSVLPLHYLYESTAGFLLPMLKGGTVAFSEGVRYIMKNMKDIKPTKMLCVPMLIETMYAKIWANIRKKGIEGKVRNVIKVTDLIRPEQSRIAAKRKAFAEIHNSFGGKLDLIVVCGAPIDPEIIKGMKAFGFKVVQGYGMTECSPFVALNPDSAPKDGAAGVALPAGELKILNAGADGVGEICYRGDNVMLGYFKQPEATAEIKKNGWLHTGDIGYIDENGYLFVMGKKKNIIVNSNGKNIFPEELETLLLRSQFVKECVIVGMKNDRRRDHDIVAVVHPDYDYIREVLGVNAKDEAVAKMLAVALEEVNASVASYKSIDLLVIRPTEFPKKSSRKIKRSGVAESILEEYTDLRG